MLNSRPGLDRDLLDNWSKGDELVPGSWSTQSFGTQSLQPVLLDFLSGSLSKAMLVTQLFGARPLRVAMATLNLVLQLKRKLAEFQTTGSQTQLDVEGPTEVDFVNRIDSIARTAYNPEIMIKRVTRMRIDNFFNQFTIDGFLGSELMGTRMIELVPVLMKDRNMGRPLLAAAIGATINTGMPRLVALQEYYTIGKMVISRLRDNQAIRNVPGDIMYNPRSKMRSSLGKVESFKDLHFKPFYPVGDTEKNFSAMLLPADPSIFTLSCAVCERDTDDDVVGFMYRLLNSWNDDVEQHIMMAKSIGSEGTDVLQNLQNTLSRIK